MKCILRSFMLLSFFVCSLGIASETVKGAKKDFEKFKTQMSTKLESVEKELSALRAITSEDAKETAKEARLKTIQELEETQKELKSQLETMKDSSDQGWKKFKKKFSQSVENLNTKIQKSLKD